MIKKSHKSAFLLVLILMLASLCFVGCRSGKKTQPTTTAPPTTTPTEPQAPEPEAKATPSTQAGTSGPTPLPSPEPIPTETTDIPWDDRTIFRDGLIQAEQDALDRLPGASVYHIDFQISDDRYILQGHETVYYTNREDVSLDAVYFRLYPNITGGAVSVSAVQVDGQEIEPVYESQDSALRVPLPAALQPGEATEIQMDFEVQVAQEMGGNYGLFGYFDGVLVLDEFYPVVAVYDDEGWNTEVPSPSGDVTHLNASFYLVRVAAPGELTVVASGVQVGREEEGDQQVLTFAAGPTRDFYLAASDKYVVVSKTVGETTVNSYAFPERTEGAELALQFGVGALESFSERFGAYPYTEFDIVSTPMLALGMEYPGITGITLRAYDPDEIIAGLPSQTILESTVAHEIAHQWFYNIVGNDQVDEPWLDEALAQYATGRYYVDTYGKAAAQGYIDSWDGRWDQVDRADIPIGLPTGAYAEDEYGAIVYGRGPIFIAALAEQIGQSTLDAFLRDYRETHEWEIATSDSFRELAEKHCQCDLGALFETWVYAKEFSEAAPITEEMAKTSPAIDELVAKLEGLDLEDFFEVSFRELTLRYPETILVQGLTEALGVQDVRLDDISDAYTRETQQMEATILKMLRAYDRDALTPEQQVSYDVYEWYLEDQVRQHAFMYYDYPATYFPPTAVHEDLIQFFTDLHPLVDKQDAEDYVTRLGLVDVKIEQLIEGLKLREEAGIVPPKFSIQWALYGLDEMTNTSATRTPFYTAFEEKVNALTDVSDAEKQALLESAEQAIDVSVIPAYQALADHLEYQESIAPTDDGVWQFPKGDAYYDYLLRHFTTTELTADEIHELGLREVERIQAEMRVIFDELGYPQDESLTELFQRVVQDSGYVVGDQVLEIYKAILDRADQNVDEAFDIRPRAKLVVIGAPFGGYYIRGSRDGSRPGAFYAGLSGQEPYYGMPTLAYHEGIPGHHFQISIAQEADLPSFRTAVTFVGYAEGWALYAERLAWELGWYDDDPYGDLGRLQGEAFRAVRLVVDTGIHAKGWTFDQAYDYMVENLGYSDDVVNLRHQVARYIVWPGQSTSYKIGMLKILELRQRAMDQLGDQFDLKEFHRVVLSNGSMPLEILGRIVDNWIQAKLNQ